MLCRRVGSCRKSSFTERVCEHEKYISYAASPPPVISLNIFIIVVIFIRYTRNKESNGPLLLLLLLTSVHFNSPHAESIQCALQYNVAPRTNHHLLDDKS